MLKLIHDSVQNEVNLTEYGGNLDRPEGVLDALMQTVACTVCFLMADWFISDS
jgi:hypothetical protein